jgi:hypothetical protein
LLLIRLDDLREHVGRHHERKSRQTPEQTHTSDMSQIDQDVRICDDGLRKSNPLISFAWDEDVCRVAAA